MSFCTDWLYFLFWMLLLLAELMLFLPPFSKFTDGLQRLLTENRLLPNVDCYGPGSWASLLVTSQALMIETSFRDCVFVFLSRRSLISIQLTTPEDPLQIFSVCVLCLCVALSCLVLSLANSSHLGLLKVLTLFQFSWTTGFGIPLFLLYIGNFV